MIKGPDSHSERFLNALAVIHSRVAKAQREISSGRKVNAPSDAPDEISMLLSLRSSLGAAEQSKSNLGRVTTEVDAAEKALAHAVEITDRIQVLGAQGATDLLDAEGRRTLAAEVEQLLGQLVNVANSEIAGRFLFAGDTDQVAPYEFDPSIDEPASTYQGAATTRELAHPSGGRIPISREANVIFEGSGPEESIFASVTKLRNALDDGDAVATRLAVGSLRSAAKYLNIQQAYYGGIQNQLKEATDVVEEQILQFKGRISSIEDADLTAAILELNTAGQAQEIALAAEAQRPRSSLFNYLR